MLASRDCEQTLKPMPHSVANRIERTFAKYVSNKTTRHALAAILASAMLSRNELANDLADLFIFLESYFSCDCEFCQPYALETVIKRCLDARANHSVKKIRKTASARRA